jgi:predicted HTH domain antitoxin
MKTIGIRALRENPGVLSQSAAKGEFVLVTNRNNPISLSIPFSDELIEEGVHVNVAVKLYEDSVITLPRAAKLAKMPVESFINTLANLGVVVVSQSADELDADLKLLNG